MPEYDADHSQSPETHPFLGVQIKNPAFAPADWHGAIHLGRVASCRPRGDGGLHVHGPREDETMHSCSKALWR